MSHAAPHHVPHDGDVPQDGGCAGCGVPADRRAFLRELAGAAAAALVALGATPAAALARELCFVAPLAAAGDTRAYPVPAADGASIDRESEVILVRWQGAVYAFSLACPHQNTALRWLASDGRFQCPKHKSKYRPDGSFIEGRATRGMDRFSVRVEDGQVVVDLNALHRQDKDAAGWAAATAPV